MMNLKKLNWKRWRWPLLTLGVLVVGFRWIPGIHGIAHDAITGEPIPYPVIEFKWWRYPLISDGPSSFESKPIRKLGNSNGEFKIHGRLVWAPWGVKMHSFYIHH